MTHTHTLLSLSFSHGLLFYEITNRNNWVLFLLGLWPSLVQQLAWCCTRSCCRWPRCWNATSDERALATGGTRRASLPLWFTQATSNTHTRAFQTLSFFFFKFIFLFIYSLSPPRARSHSLSLRLGHWSISVVDADWSVSLVFLFPSWWHSAQLVHCSRRGMSCWWWWWCWMKAHSSFDFPTTRVCVEFAAPAPSRCKLKETRALDRHVC